MPWEAEDRLIFATKDDPVVWSNLRRKYMLKSEADVWKEDMKKLDAELREKINKVLVHKGKSTIFHREEVVSQRYTMESLRRSFSPHLHKLTPSVAPSIVVEAAAGELRPSDELATVEPPPSSLTPCQ